MPKISSLNSWFDFVVFLVGALFNQLTIYITKWRRNHLHKKGNRVKVDF